MHKGIFSFAISFLLCGSAQASTLRLKFLADTNIPSGTSFQHFTMGGLSGLTYNPLTKHYYAVSDDRSQVGPARFYKTAVEFAEGKINFRILDFVHFKDENNWIMPSGEIDTESIVRLKDGTLLVGSEGDSYKDDNNREVFRFPPALYAFRDDGSIKARIAIPTKYIPEPLVIPADPNELPKAATRGMRYNKGFEGLALSPQEDFLLASPETPLRQDDSPPDFTKGGQVRMLTYTLKQDELTPSREYVYPLDPVYRPAGVTTAAKIENGISEILCIGDDNYLALERGGIRRTSQSPYEQHVSIFNFHLAGATDVQHLETLHSTSVAPIRKTLVLDTNDIIAQLSPDYQSIDNLEGMAIGPTLPNGHRTLIVISDDNFSAKQRTQVLLFEMIENSSH